MAKGRKYVAAAIVLAVLVPTGALLVHSGRNALQANASEAASWWQVFLATLSLPLLLYGLARLRQELAESQWKPEIEIGVVPGTELVNDFRSHHMLPAVARVSQGYPSFTLAVRNAGRRAAKYPKMHLEFLSYAEDTPETTIVRLKPQEGNPFEWRSNIDFICEGGSALVVYPLDTMGFRFYIATCIFLSREKNITEPPAARNYHFRCTVWAEGLEKPATQDLTVKIEHDPKALEVLRSISQRGAEQRSE